MEQTASGRSIVCFMYTIRRDEMKITEIKSLAIPDVKVIQFGRFSDDRGYFTETYRKSDLKNHEPFKNLLHVAFPILHYSNTPIFPQTDKYLNGTLSRVTQSLPSGPAH